MAKLISQVYLDLHVLFTFAITYWIPLLLGIVTVIFAFFMASYRVNTDRIFGRTKKEQVRLGLLFVAVLFFGFLTYAALQVSVA